MSRVVNGNDAKIWRGWALIQKGAKSSGALAKRLPIDYVKKKKVKNSDAVPTGREEGFIQEPSSEKRVKNYKNAVPGAR